jgi:transcription factor CRZ1
MDQQQDRPSSVGPQSHITRHYQEDSGLGFALDPLLSTTNNQQFSNSREYSNSFLASQQIQQYPQATIRETNFSPNQDLNSQSDQIAQEEVSQQNQSSISPFGHQHQTSFTEELLNANTFAEGDFSLYSNPGGPEEQFEHAFFLNDPSQDSPPSVNPADVMSDMSSPQVQHTPTPPHVLYDPHQSSSAHASPSFNQHQFQQPRGIKVEHQQPSSTHASPPFNQHQFQSSGLKSETKQSSSTHNSPSFNQNQFQHPPTHSRNTSLGPESAVFPQAQMSTEWSMMPPQFTNHRRSPSEYSDVSSAAPSPNLPQQDTFEPTEQNPSPLVHPQDSGLYKDVLEIRNFSLSDSQAQHGASPHRGLSPAHTPSMSPRLGPQPMPMINQSAFMLNAGMSDNGFGPSVPDMYDSQNQGQFGRNSSVEVGPGPGPGQAQQMMPPEINVEFAPTSRQSSFDPPKPSLDQDSLTPPSQSKFCAPAAD